MTDNTMREGKLWAFLRDSIHEAYKKLSTTGTSNEYHALLDSIASKVADDVDARFLQVAQSEQAVPVEVFDSRCNYASFAGRVCNKCGRIHDGGKSVAVLGEPDCYDAGLLGDFGGGNVEWWQDYIRAELARAHDFYASQWPSATPAADLATLREKAAQLEQVEKERDEANARLHDVSVACATAEQERDELRKDAERYRWLRDPSVYVGKVIDKVAGYEPMTELGTGGYPIYEYRAGSELDEAIDAAIAQGKGE